MPTPNFWKMKKNFTTQKYTPPNFQKKNKKIIVVVVNLFSF